MIIEAVTYVNEMSKLCKIWKKNLRLNYMLMLIFSECMASSSFNPLWICAVDVGDDEVIWLVHSGISESLQQNDFVMVIRLFFFFCHHFSLLSVFIRVCKYLYIIHYQQNVFQQNKCLLIISFFGKCVVRVNPEW